MTQETAGQINKGFCLCGEKLITYAEIETGLCQKCTEQTGKRKEILKILNDFSGTEHYYNIPLSNFKHTDGVYELINSCRCWWLISDTAIYLNDLKEQIHNSLGELPDFLILTIKVNPDKSAIVTLKEDTDLKPIYERVYSYTDFPLSEFEFYIINDVFLLKSEY